MLQAVKDAPIRVIVYIKKVQIALKFNCKLSFIIRNQRSETIAETDQTYSLTRGQCLVNKLLHFELPKETIANKCKKLKILIMSMSANGSVPAGFVCFPSQQQKKNEQMQYTLNMERCQDKKAHVKFMHMNEDALKTSFQQSFIHKFMRNKSLDSERIQKYSVQRSKSGSSLSRQNNARRRKRYQFESPVQRFSQAKTKRSQNDRIATQRDNILISQTKPKSHIDQPNNNQKSVKEILDETSKEQIIKENQQYWTQLIHKEQQIQQLRAQVQSFKRNFQKLTKQYNFLQFQHISLKEFYETQEQKVQILVSEIKSNSQTILQLQSVVKSKQELQNIKNHYQNKIKKYERAIEELENRNKRLDLQLTNLTIKKEDSEVILIIKEQKISYLQQKLQKQIQKNGILLFKANKQQDTIDSVQKEIKELIQINQSFEHQFQYLKNREEQYEIMKNKYNLLSEELREETQNGIELQIKYQQAISELQALEKNDADHHEILDKLKKFQQQNDHLKGQINKMKQQKIEQLDINIKKENIKQEQDNDNFKEQQNIKYELMQKVITLQKQLQIHNAILQRQIRQKQDSQDSLSKVEAVNDKISIDNAMHIRQKIELLHVNEQLQESLHFMQEKSISQKNSHEKQKQKFKMDLEQKNVKIGDLKTKLKETIGVNIKLTEDISMYILQNSKMKEIYNAKPKKHLVQDPLASDKQIQNSWNASVNLQIQSKMQDRKNQKAFLQRIVVQDEGKIKKEQQSQYRII